MSAALETLRVERPTAHVAVVWLNRPESGNGVVPAMAREPSY